MKFQSILLFLFIMWNLFAADESYALPAFPRAEGYGTHTIGGRGGKVIKVTNLNPIGPGSFKVAAELDIPRIIIFEVGGIIPGLKQNIGLPGYCTVAGQTAANWGGVTLNYGDLGDKGTGIKGNVVLRHFRVRGTEGGEYGRAYSVGSAYTPTAKNIILDHLSSVGSCDQDVNLRGVDSSTVSWIISAEMGAKGQCGCNHEEGNHNRPIFLNGGVQGGFSFHHNIVANGRPRSPQFIGDFDMRNNTIYNCCWSNFYKLGNPNILNVINNYWKDGDAWAVQSNYAQPECGSTNHWYNASRRGDGFSIYLSGNISNRDKNVNISLGKDGTNATYLTQASNVPPVTTYSADEGHTLVLERGGAWPRDNTDKRIVDKIRNGTGTWSGGDPAATCFFESDDLTMPKNHTDFTSPNKPLPAPFNERVDSDGGGIPDQWETANGLDINDALDDVSTTLHGEYLNIEVWFNQMAEVITPPFTYTDIKGLPIVSGKGPNKQSPLSNESISLSFFPNPSRKNIVFKLSGNFSKGTLTIHDIGGRLVKKMPINTSEINWDGRAIDGKIVNTGLYFVSYKDQNGVWVRRKMAVGIN